MNSALATAVPGPVTYTRLPDRFSKHGQAFTLLKRVSDIALVEQSAPHWKTPVYVVAIVQHRKQHTFPNGHVTLAHEAMPSPEQWGDVAWTYSRLPDAEAKFTSLVGPIATTLGKPLKGGGKRPL